MISEHLRLVGIFDPRKIPGFRTACREAVVGGVTALQVRMKNAPAHEILAATEAIIASVDVPVYVNDRADVAWAARAAGVHVGSEDLPEQVVRRLSPAPFLIGVSVGTVQEAHHALAGSADYWSIGSVYATGSKPDAGGPIGISGLTELIELVPERVRSVAIGGINAANVGDVMSCGVDGVAVISAIFGASNVRGAARRMREAMDGY